MRLLGSWASGTASPRIDCNPEPTSPSRTCAHARVDESPSLWVPRGTCSVARIQLGKHCAKEQATALTGIPALRISCLSVLLSVVVVKKMMAVMMMMMMVMMMVTMVVGMTYLICAFSYAVAVKVLPRRVNVSEVPSN